MVAVPGEEVVGCALEDVGGFFDDGVYLVMGLDCKAVQDLAFECPSRGNCSWGSVVYAG